MGTGVAVVAGGSRLIQNQGHNHSTQHDCSIHATTVDEQALSHSLAPQSHFPRAPGAGQKPRICKGLSGGGRVSKIPR